jgi:hypothetical protein
MGSRVAKFVFAVLAGILAGAAFSAPRNAANAAECLTQPGQDAPKGQRWHYHVERETKRHCWYLREESDKAAHITPPLAAQSAAVPAPPTQAGDSPLRSLEDARAEFPTRQQRLAETPATAAAAPSVTQAASEPSSNQPQADVSSSAVSSRWPAPSDVSPAAVPSPIAADRAMSETTVQNAPAPAASPIAAETATERPSASLGRLFAVIAGALALAGLIASIVLRLGKSRRVLIDARRRGAIWDRVDGPPEAASIPPWSEPVVDEPSATVQPTVRRGPAQERYQKIEEILAELVRQAQESDGESASLSPHVPS